MAPKDLIIEQSKEIQYLYKKVDRMFIWVALLAVVASAEGLILIFKP